MRWDHIGLSCFFVSYALAFLLEVARLFSSAPRTALNRWGVVALTCGGITAQTIYLVVRSRQLGLPPLLGSMHDWLLVLAWCGALGLFVLEIVGPQSSIPLFVWPVDLLLIAGAAFSPHNPSDFAQELRAWGMWHATLLVFGIGGIVIASAVSLMYLVQHRRLKSGRIDALGLHLISLEQLGLINWWSIVISVPLLTGGMAVGVWLTFLARRTGRPVDLWQTEFLLYGLLWLALLLLFSWVLLDRRPAGRVIAWRTIWSGGFLLATMLLLGVIGRGHGGVRPAKPADEAAPPALRDGGGP